MNERTSSVIRDTPDCARLHLGTTVDESRNAVRGELRCECLGSIPLRVGGPLAQKRALIFSLQLFLVGFTCLFTLALKPPPARKRKEKKMEKKFELAFKKTE